MPVHHSQSYSTKGAIKKTLQIAFNAARQKKDPQFVIAHANNLPVAEYYAAEIKKAFGYDPLYILPASPTLGAHAGNGAVGIGFSWSEDD